MVSSAALQLLVLDGLIIPREPIPVQLAILALTSKFLATVNDSGIAGSKIESDRCRATDADSSVSGTRLNDACFGSGFNGAVLGTNLEECLDLGCTLLDSLLPPFPDLWGGDLPLDGAFVEGLCYFLSTGEGNQCQDSQQS